MGFLCASKCDIIESPPNTLLYSALFSRQQKMFKSTNDLKKRKQKLSGTERLSVGINDQSKTTLVSEAETQTRMSPKIVIRKSSGYSGNFHSKLTNFPSKIIE